MCELVAFASKPSDPIDIEQIKAAVGQNQQELRALLDAVGRQRLESELYFPPLVSPLREATERACAARMQIDAAQCDVGALAELKAVERHAIEARRLFRCERIGGSVASTCGVVDRLVRRTNRRRLNEVIREIGERRVRMCLCKPLNDLAHSLVQPAPAGRAQVRVHGLPNERMKEARIDSGRRALPRLRCAATASSRASRR